MTGPKDYIKVFDAIRAYAILLRVIDWLAVLFNAFWILGLAVLLAAFSYQHWLARQTNIGLKEQLYTSAFGKAFWFSFVLVAIGLAGTSQRSWEAIIWAVFAIIGLVFIIRKLKE